MASGRHPFTRLGLAAVLAAGVGLAMSPAASADGTTATYVGTDSDTASSVVVKRSNGDSYTTGTNVKLLQVGSGDDARTLKTYCIELDTEIGDEGTKYQETDWQDYFASSDYKNAAPKVNWILRHSYPALSIDELKKELRDAPEFDGQDLDKLTEPKAAAGTQAAIWHYTNDADLASNKNPAIVQDLYDYLTGDANVGVSNEPRVSLDISAKDDSLTGKPGEPLGPLTVKTTSSNPVDLSVKSKTDGVRLVQKTDKGYEKVTKVSDGGKFYVDVPADAEKGKATIKADTMATVEAGRVFTGASDAKKTQTLILAGPAQVHVSVQAEFSWQQSKPSTPSPTPSETSGENEAPVPTPVHTKAPVTG